MLGLLKDQKKQPIKRAVELSVNIMGAYNMSLEANIQCDSGRKVNILGGWHYR